MKTKIVISIAVFIGMIIYLKGITVVGLSTPTLLANMPWNLEKVYIWFFILISAVVFASIPWWIKIVKFVFK